jgi:proteasome assembly chaperone 4
MATDLISVRTKYVAPAEAALPALGVHITRLVDSYMVWVGVTDETAETVEHAPRGGSLCRDWACAMPPTPGSAVSVAAQRCGSC